MANLSFFAHDYGDHEVRVTADRRFSVYDVLVAFGVCNSSDVRMVFKRMKEGHSEVVTFCDDFKFPGRGQRNTPITDEEGIYQILMLCPGKRGAEFRKWAAGILADPEKALDHSIRGYKRQGKSNEWIRARLEGKLQRHGLTETLKLHGVTGHGYAACTDAINVGLTGKTAKALKAERSVQRTRDGLSEVELAAYALTEAIARNEIQESNAQGNNACRSKCADAANRVRRVFE